MINFCDWRLKAKITCDKVSVDGYSPENLVSKNFTERARGFLSESFVKPPINLTVHLPCNIEIYRITMDPQVGAQKSTGIDLYTASRRLNNSWLCCGCSKETCSVCKFTVRDSDTNNLIFVSVAKLLMNPPGKVCFENPRYSDTEHIPDWLFSSSEYKFHSVLRHREKCSLSNVSHVTIRITRTGVNNAALKNLEIWGQLALSCSRSLHQNVYSVMKNSDPFKQNTELKQNADSMSEASGVAGQCLPSTSQSAPAVSIPDDFVDPITCEIMALPVVLPSGKNIDQLTLDKHIEREASWGRPPNDPFTGVAFTNKTKPFLNAALKTRIDSFLLQYGDRFRDAPRTVGSKKNFQKDWNDKAAPEFQSVSCASRHMKHTGTHGMKIEPDSSLSMKSRHSDKVSVTHPQVEQASTSRKLKRVLGSSGQDNAMDDLRNKKLKMMSISVESLLDTSDKLSHENELQSSLNADLDSTLSNLTSFTQLNKDNKRRSQNEKNQCTVCLSDSNDKGLSMYQLPCGHIICRPCLLNQSTQIHCQVCKLNFTSKDVKKFNSS